MQKRRKGEGIHVRGRVPVRVLYVYHIFIHIFFDDLGSIFYIFTNIVRDTSFFYIYHLYESKYITKYYIIYVS
jgi:hypothetical protein